MSGCLVSRYSIAGLWSEWEAPETWEAILAVSYVSLATRECSACSLLTFANRESCGLSIISFFSKVTFSFQRFLATREGYYSTRRLTQSSLSWPHLCCLVWLMDTCSSVIVKKAMTCFCAYLYSLLFAVQLFIQLTCETPNCSESAGKVWVLEIKSAGLQRWLSRGNSICAAGCLSYRLNYTKIRCSHFIIASLTEICQAHFRSGLETLHCSLFYCYSKFLSNVNR